MGQRFCSADVNIYCTALNVFYIITKHLKRKYAVKLYEPSEIVLITVHTRKSYICISKIIQPLNTKQCFYSQFPLYLLQLNVILLKKEPNRIIKKNKTRQLMKNLKGVCHEIFNIFEVVLTPRCDAHCGVRLRCVHLSAVSRDPNFFNPHPRSPFRSLTSRGIIAFFGS